MKAIIKTLVLILVISFTMVATSCSKKSSAFSHSSNARHNSTSYDPVQRKSQPVRKKYIVNGKRKAILGHEIPQR